MEAIINLPSVIEVTFSPHAYFHMAWSVLIEQALAKPAAERLEALDLQTFRGARAVKTSPRDVYKRSVIRILCIWKSLPEHPFRRFKWLVTLKIALLVDLRDD